ESEAATSPAGGIAAASALAAALSTAAPAPVAPLPSTWIWNWTWTCGDIAGSGITQTIDTAINTWTWTWNLGGTCNTATPTSPDIHPVIPPAITAPDLPSAPGRVHVTAAALAAPARPEPAAPAPVVRELSPPAPEAAPPAPEAAPPALP